MRLFAFLPAVIGMGLLAGCLQDGVVGRDTPDGANDDGAGTGPDAGQGQDAIAASEAGPGTDGSPVESDAGPTAIASPNPPAGTSLCGQGTFTQADSVAACENATVVSQVALVHPTPATPITSQCDGITASGGSWQVWCSSTVGVYFFVQWDSPVATGTIGSCAKGGQDLTPTEGWVGIYNAVAERQELSGPLPDEPKLYPTKAQFIINPSETGVANGGLAANVVAVEQTVAALDLENFDFGVDTTTHGSGYVFYGVMLSGECNGTEPIVVGGIPVSWSGGK